MHLVVVFLFELGADVATVMVRRARRAVRGACAAWLGLGLRVRVRVRVRARARVIVRVRVRVRVRARCMVPALLAPG